MDAAPSEPVPTRERILAAAAECFAKAGYERARMVAVAERAGVSRAGLYLHFRTKEALLAGLNQSVIEEWLALSARTLTADAPALQAIAGWIREGLSSQAQLAGVRVVTADETQQALLLDRGATEQALAHTLGMLTAVLRRGVRRGELARDLDVSATAQSLQALLLGLLRNHVSERPLVDVRDERHLAAVVSLVTRGLAR
jgi:TetR/AcrR family transcriptional repressor of uid operon